MRRVLHHRGGRAAAHAGPLRALLLPRLLGGLASRPALDARLSARRRAPYPGPHPAIAGIRRSPSTGDSPRLALPSYDAHGGARHSPSSNAPAERSDEATRDFWGLLPRAVVQAARCSPRFALAHVRQRHTTVPAS